MKNFFNNEKVSTLILKLIYYHTRIRIRAYFASLKALLNILCCVYKYAIKNILFIFYIYFMYMLSIFQVDLSCEGVTSF